MNTVDQMNARAWWKEAVVYEVYPRSFQDTTGNGVGDIPGVIKRLDYLALLGVDVIWLSPVYESPNVDNGYDISDYQKIMDEFGTMGDFDRLLAEAHWRGIKVILDLVVNHTSDRHAWFAESRKDRTNPKNDWYIWRDGAEAGDGNRSGGRDPNRRDPNRLESVFYGSAWQYAEERGQYYLHMFAKEQPDLNWDNPQVREAVFAMMRWWLDKGIDGFRMDVISMISKPPKALANDGGDGQSVVHGPRVHEYLQEMREKVLSRYDIMTVGETAGVTIEEAQKYAGYDTGELNMVFQFDLMDVELTGAGAYICGADVRGADVRFGKWSDSRFKLTEVKQVMTKWQTRLYGKAWNSLFWSNHDQPRCVSRFGNDSTSVLREKSAKMLAACLHLMQGTPYIYQGEELGMTNYPFVSLDECRDVEIFNTYEKFVRIEKSLTHDAMMEAIRRRGRDNARTPMQWDAGKNAGFTTGTPWIAVNPNYPEINAEDQIADPHSVFSFYRKLIALRKNSPARDLIVYGRYNLLLPGDERLYVYERSLEGGRPAQRLLVLCNFTAETVPVDFAALCQNMPPNLPPEAYRLLISNYNEAEIAQTALRPYEASAYTATCHLPWRP
ncbi:MAG: alpha-glucosidase [Spirochaetaceae bacterium]|jgi:oligo-1,6-glucosidase|nr:alpha-glucosidase [Spirochaetaceae bacterium]